VNGDIAATKAVQKNNALSSAHVDLAHAEDFVPPSQEPPVPPAPVVSQPEPVQAPQSSSKLWWIVGAIAALVIIGGLGTLLLMNRGEPEPEPTTPPVVQQEVCEYDATLLADDPDCVEVETCEFNASLEADDPNCFEPCEFDATLAADSPDCITPQVEEAPPCQYNATILSTDPDCVKPEPCPYSDILTADDPDCVEPEPVDTESEPEEEAELPDTGDAK